jgi:hypothetical protein
VKKLSIKELVEFRSKSERAKTSFIEKLKSPKIEAPKEAGGDYWISGLSAVCSAFKDGTMDKIDQKISDLQTKKAATRLRIVTDMYQRNIDILQQFKRMDMKRFRPDKELTFLKKSSASTLLTLKGLEVKAVPSQIFTFEEDEINIGVIWFIARKKAYKLEEVGMYCDLLQKFLHHNFSKKYKICSNFCTVVDMSTRQIVNYSEIESGSVSKILDSTLDDLSRRL